MTEYSTSIWSSNKFLVVRTVIRSFLFFPPATKRKQCFKCNVGKVVLQSSVDTTEYLLDLPHESERARKTLSIEHSSSLFLCHVTYHHERREFLPLPYKIRECNARKKRLGCRAFSERKSLIKEYNFRRFCSNPRKRSRNGI